MYLVPDEMVPVKEPVRGLIATSANDAALVVSERVGGSLADFEQIMNQTAQQLGMKHTHYSTPSVITTRGNDSIAHDLSTLALRLTRETFRSTTPSYQSRTLHLASSISQAPWLVTEPDTGIK